MDVICLKDVIINHRIYRPKQYAGQATLNNSCVCIPKLQKTIISAYALYYSENDIYIYIHRYLTKVLSKRSIYELILSDNCIRMIDSIDMPKLHSSTFVS